MDADNAVRLNATAGSVKLIGTDVDVNNKNIINVADGVNPTDAVNKKQLDDNKSPDILPLDNTFSGLNQFNYRTTHIRGADMRYQTIFNVATPANDGDASNKLYVDTQILTRASQAALDTKADNSAIDTINVELGVQSTNITQNTNDILLKASQVALDNLTAAVGTQLNLKADKTYVDDKVKPIDTLYKRANTSIASTTTAGDSTSTISNIFDSAT